MIPNVSNVFILFCNCDNGFIMWIYYNLLNVILFSVSFIVSFLFMVTAGLYFVSLSSTFVGVWLGSVPHSVISVKKSSSSSSDCLNYDIICTWVSILLLTLVLSQDNCTHISFKRYNGSMLKAYFVFSRWAVDSTVDSRWKGEKNT